MLTSIEDGFKQAMRRLAATVTLITLMEDDAPKGMAATAVCSLSMAPASLLVCINKSASLHDIILAAGHFGVNILHKDQIEVSRRFSDKCLKEARFENADWGNHHLGPPMLAGVQVGIVCKRSAFFSFGTHTILVGEVVDVKSREDIDPLIYLDGTFGGVHR